MKKPAQKHQLAFFKQLDFYHDRRKKCLQVEFTLLKPPGCQKKVEWFLFRSWLLGDEGTIRSPREHFSREKPDGMSNVVHLDVFRLQKEGRQMTDADRKREILSHAEEQHSYPGLRR